MASKAGDLGIVMTAYIGLREMLLAALVFAFLVDFAKVPVLNRLEIV